MANILILYPKQWKCYSKFERKVKKITSKIDSFAFFFINDDNLFIDKLANNLGGISVHPLTDLQEISHAIIFNDGEEFIDIYRELQKKDIPLRNINIKITKVINIKNEENAAYLTSEQYEYIGRGSYWGNPYSMFEEGEDRDEVIRKFKYDFDRDLFPNKQKNKVYELTGKTLGCFCKPHNCHGDVLADYLNSYDDGL